MQRTGTGDWLSTRMGKLPSEPGSISIVPPQRGRRNDDPTPVCEGPLRAVVERDQVEARLARSDRSGSRVDFSSTWPIAGAIGQASAAAVRIDARSAMTKSLSPSARLLAARRASREGLAER